MIRIAVCWALVMSAASLHGQVVLSRRVYAEHGRTWQQLWNWSPSDGALKPLTNTPRDHSQPHCSRDNRRIFFISDTDSFDKSVWSFDRSTLEERKVRDISDMEPPNLVGIAKDGGLLILRKDGLHKGAPGPFHIALKEPDGAAVSPDGARAAVTTGEGDTFLTDTATGKSRVPIGKCGFPVWSPDGTRVVCTADQDVVIIDAGTGKGIERVRFTLRDSGPEVPVWSPDGRKLLLGTYSDNGISSVDYFVLDLGAGTWNPAMTGSNAVWLPGRDAILYTTPRDLTPLSPGSKHGVWTTQLALFDLASRKETLLTSGLTNVDNLTLCGGANGRSWKGITSVLGDAQRIAVRVPEPGYFGGAARRDPDSQLILLQAWISLEPDAGFLQSLGGMRNVRHLPAQHRVARRVQFLHWRHAKHGAVHIKDQGKGELVQYEAKAENVTVEFPGALRIDGGHKGNDGLLTQLERFLHGAMMTQHDRPRHDLLRP